MRDGEECILIVLGYLERAGQVLITRRALGTPQGGRWEFPGGKVEVDESLPAALQRELWEEIGVRASIGDELAMTRYRYPDICVELHLFRCTTSDAPSSLQVSELRWAPIAELADIDFPPANGALLAALRA